MLLKLLSERSFLIFLIFFTSQPVLNAQLFKYTFHKSSLSDALLLVSKENEIRVAFDASKLGALTIDGEITGNTFEELLNNLLDNTGFGYKFKYNRYLIVATKKDHEDLHNGKAQLTGSVSDTETGESLPYATILFFDQNVQTSATESGSFCLKDITSNPVHLTVSYIGYNKLDTTVSWSDKNINLDLRLYRKEHLLDTIIVHAERPEMIDLRNDVDFATTVNPAKLSDLPVLAETDIFKILQLLPGINYSENSSGMSIRGGTSDQNLVLFDGQTLYNLSHYYGVVSALNPNVIKDMQVYKGGYDSRFGERVSGIVDITGKSGNQTKPTFYGDINLLSGNITAEIPLSRKITFLGAYRRSYSDIYSTSLSQSLVGRNLDVFGRDSINIVNLTRPDFKFQDYNAKLTIKPDNLETISFSIYGGNDSYKNSYTGTSRMLIVDGTDINNWSNYGASASWLRQWNESFFSNLQAGTSGYSNSSSSVTAIDRSRAVFDSIPSLPDTVNTFGSFNKNKLSDIFFSAKNTYVFSNRHQLNFGFLTRRNTIYYYKDAGSIYIYDNTNQTGWTNSVYFQDKITTDKGITLKPGLRLTYFNGTNDIYFEPRFSVNYKVNDLFSLRAALGRYYQFINQVMALQETGYNKNFWVMADNVYHPEVASNHFIAGLTAENGRFLFDGEAYIKTFSGLQDYIYVSQFLKNSDLPGFFPKKSEIVEPDVSKPSFFVTGSGRSYGIDVLLRYKSNSYTGWLSYSWGRSLHRYRDINSGNEVPSPTDVPHQLSWTNMLSEGRWKFSTVTIFTSGRSYADFTRARPNLPLNVEYKRLPNYFRSDFSVNYSFPVGKIKLKTGATLINIFNTRNYFDINTRKFDFENNSFSETTLIQSQAFSINLFLHFLF